MGQFERTLIIADGGAYVHYVGSCIAPIYKSDSLYAAIVKIFVKKNAQVRYTTTWNWSDSVLNLVTQHAIVEERTMMEQVDGNIGSYINVGYPSMYLTGPHARGEALSIAFAGKGQCQDTDAKMIHSALNASSHVVSKPISRQGGHPAYRGLVAIDKETSGSRPNVLCDVLLVDTISRLGTYPYVDVCNDEVGMGHEATVPKAFEDQLFYLVSRGLTEIETVSTTVRGFVEPVAKELLMEYALGLNRLIELQVEGSVG